MNHLTVEETRYLRMYRAASSSPLHPDVRTIPQRDLSSGVPEQYRESVYRQCWDVTILLADRGLLHILNPDEEDNGALPLVSLSGVVELQEW